MTVTVTSINRVSTTSTGVQGNDDSWQGLLSPDGTKLLFSSEGTNFVAGDSDPLADIFIKDLTTGAITLVSGSPSGDVANNVTEIGGWSPDGTKVVFSSAATNLVSGDTEVGYDIFLYDVASGTTTLLSTATDGVTPASGSTDPVFSPDGTKIMFSSTSRLLIEGDPNPPGGPFIVQIYIKDLITGDTIRVSETALGEKGDGHSQAARWSPDGTKVTFSTYATNLASDGNTDNTDVVVKDLLTGVTTVVSTDAAGNPANFALMSAFSPDGTKLAFLSSDDSLTPGDTNGDQDIFIKDLTTGEITNISRTIGGISANGFSAQPVWSPDGTYIAFFSDANLVGGENNNGGADVFIKDLITGVVSRVSVDLTGLGGNNDSRWASFSADGTQLVLGSEASNFVAGDTNARADVFILDLLENNEIIGSIGDDHIYGRDTSEVIKLREGNDFVAANGGDDTIHAGAGDDVVFGGEGNDYIHGEGDNDEIHGGSGADEIRGGAGNDVLFGDGDNDYIYGGSGADTLWGGYGADNLRGDEGDDTLRGGNANDDLRGGIGNDSLVGGAHADDLYGEGGADAFIFDADAFIGARDRIKDFDDSEGDSIVLDQILFGYDPGTSLLADFVTITQSGGHSFVNVDRDGAGGTYGFHETARIDNVTGLDADDMLAAGSLVIVV